MYWVDPYHYFLEGVVTDVLHGQVVQCTEQDYIKILPPPSFTCSAYLGAYITGSPEIPGQGYLGPDTDNGYCRYCVYKSGDEFFAQSNWSADDR